MTIENIKDIRQTITLAKEYEQQSGDFKKILNNNRHQLHSAIDLSAAKDLNHEIVALQQFVLNYVEHVPNFLDAIYQISEQANIDTDIEPFLKIAEEYFLKPPEVVDGHRGLDALMDEAYLAHRLMEELNDRFIHHCGIPLAPLDMTRANLIIHHLIGEPFANELDSIVQYAADQLVNQAQVFENENFKLYANEHRSRGWSEELKRWPCLTQDMDIDLAIGSDSQSEAEENEFTVH